MSLVCPPRTDLRSGCISDQCQVNGAVPITCPQVEIMLRRVMDELMGRSQTWKMFLGDEGF